MMECNDGGIRKKEFIENLIHTDKEYQKNLNENHVDSNTNNMLLFEKPYNYGSHYSNPIYVTHFLSRIFPFCNILIELQGDRFDEPDRIFISVKDTFHSCTTQKGDLRELIPEFFSIPEMFFNINNFDMGIKVNKVKVDGVDTGFGDAYKFVYLNNLALEKDEVSLNLNNWIDLIFGYKQRGKEAEKNNNVHRFASYMDLVDIEKYNEEAKLYFYRFLEFGCCPMQLFKKPFDKRDCNVIKIKREIIDKDSNVITLNIKNSKNTVDFFPIEKGVKILFNDFKGVDYKQINGKDNNYKYEQRLFLYSHGFVKDEKLIGDSKIYPKIKPYFLYSNARFLIEGGFLCGEMVISDFKENKGYIFYNPNDYSVVIDINLNKDENFGIVANEIGIIYIYKVNNQMWENRYFLNSHTDKIKHISINEELNSFASCAFDDYINIYSMPSCKIIHSFIIKKPEFVFLSGRPLASCIIYSNEYKKFFVYSVNGNLIKEESCEYLPESPFLYKDKYFRDYLIYGCKGTVFIKTLPYMEIYNTIKFGDNELSLKLSKNIEGEKMYVYDKNKEILYIIG